MEMESESHDDLILVAHFTSDGEKHESSRRTGCEHVA